MAKKILAAASALLFGMTCADALAAQTWTITTKGVISNGVDVTGVFGFAGQDLKGKAYSQTITTSIDPADWKNGEAAFESFWGNINAIGLMRVTYIDGTGPGFTTTYTVDGHSVAFTTASTSFGAQIVADDNYPHPQPSKAFIQNSHAGYTANGDYLRSSQDASGYFSGFQYSAKFNQTFSQRIDQGANGASASFSIYGTNIASFDANADYFAISSVPEPETYAMLLAGLGLIGLAQRRRAQA